MVDGHSDSYFVEWAETAAAAAVVAAEDVEKMMLAPDTLDEWTVAKLLLKDSTNIVRKKILIQQKQLVLLEERYKYWM